LCSGAPRILVECCGSVIESDQAVQYFCPIPKIYSRAICSPSVVVVNENSVTNIALASMHMSKHFLDRSQGAVFSVVNLFIGGNLRSIVGI
jgi:hypothetical protein